MLIVDIDVVLVTVVALAVFLGPAGAQVLLPLHVGLVIPPFGRFAFLDLLIFIPSVPVLRCIHQTGIDDLPALGHQSRIPEPLIKGIE